MLGTSTSTAIMRLTWCVLCLAAIVLTVDGRSGGRSSSGGSRSSGSRSSGGGYSSGSRSSGSSSSGSRSHGSSSSSSGYGSGSSYSKPTYSHSSSSGYGGYNSHSSGSSNHFGGSSGTIPKSTNTHHSQSHVIPLSAGARTPVKPTSRPEFRINTPKPFIHPLPGGGTFNSANYGGGSNRGSSSGRHNSTFGGGFHHGSSSGRHNSTFGGGFNHGSSSGRHNSTLGGGFNHGSSSGRQNSTFGGGFNHGSSSGRQNSTGGIGFHQGSTGGKVNEHMQQSHVSNQHSSGGINPHAPSAPQLPTGSNPHSPSAPPLPGSGNYQPGHQPPGPGWHPGVTNDAAQKQHMNNLNNQHPGGMPLQPGGGGYYPNQNPPMNPGGGGYYPNQGPVTHPGGGGYYPNQGPPMNPGGGGYYPNQGPAIHPGGGYYPNHHPTNQHYPVQAGGPVYQTPYHPPPPPPGYTPYGVPFYKEKSGIRGTDVVAGLALWELMRSRNHHHHYGIQQVHHHHYQDGVNSGSYDSTYYQPTYHDTMRERYTTRTNPPSRPGPGAYNILEMTHYITPDEQGVISSSEGNMTCVSVYNANSVNKWHQKQVDDFKKQYPNSIFPLYRTENDTHLENFTVTAGRIIHREPVTITCCGTNKGKLDLNLLTNGKHPDVNCVNHLGHIPIKKLIFARTQMQTVNTTGWHEVQLRDPNATTPVPLAPFPTNFNTNTSTPTPLAPFPPSLPYSSIETLPPLAPFPTNVTTSTASPVDMNQTFAPIGVRNGTATVDMAQIFNSLASNSTEGVTNNPSDLIVG